MHDIGQLGEIRPNKGLKLHEVNFCSPVGQLSLITFCTVLYLFLCLNTKCICTSPLVTHPFESETTLMVVI